MGSKIFPKARTEGLIVEELDAEVLVYDMDRDRAHCLNSTAAFVWKHCDGLTSAGEIARRLQRKTQNLSASLSTVDVTTEDLVLLALEQLNRDHLLAEQTVAPLRAPRISRREALRRVGIGAAIAVPIVASITAPTAVQAGSCKPSGASCGTGSQCCSGICNGNVCT